MARLPIDGRWTQINDSEKFGSIAYSKNLKFDERGFMKLSPRTVTIMDEDEDAQFNVANIIGKSAGGTLVINTNEAVFDAVISTTVRSFTENTGTNEPTMTPDSHGAYFNDLWFGTTNTTVVSKSLTGLAAATWTDRVTGLTSARRHYLEVFKNRNEICVTNGNTVQCYNSSYAIQNTLTIPSDFEIIGIAYNNNRMAVATRPVSNDTNANALLFIWDGASNSALGGFDTGAASIIAVAPYKSSFAAFTRRGELLYFNGGGFDQLAVFPYFTTERKYGVSTDNLAVGTSMISEGDKLFINTFFQFNGFGRKAERFMVENPSGVWCYDPEVGLYHRYSPSISQAEVFEVTSANVNTGTEVMTITSGTVPATGNIARYTSVGTTTIGGLDLGRDYYIINLSSTTFSLALTRALADIGTAINLTAAGTGNNSFYMYDLVDFGATYVNLAGAIASMGDTTTFYQEFIFGGDYFDTLMATNDTLCLATPFLENRGYAVLAKLFSPKTSDIAQKVIIRFRILDTNDVIVLKRKHIDVFGLPVTTSTTRSADRANWTSANELNTTQDLSEAVTFLSNNSGKLELEVIAGAGAGTMVQVTSMTADAGVTSIVLDENVQGASSGLDCDFVLENWEVMDQITPSSTTADLGYMEIPVGKVNKFTQFKLELRGWNVTIEDIDIVNVTSK